MKNVTWIALCLTIWAGCGAPSDETGEQGPGQPTVYVSNYPLKYLAERIGAPVVRVILPVPAEVDPAYWKPTPEDVLAMQRADLIILNGASYESWLANVSLPQSRIVDTTRGIADRLIPLSDQTTHSHGLEGEHEHSGTAFTTWLDLSLALEQARVVEEAMAVRWPRHSGQFEAQLESLAKDLEELDAQIKEIVEGNQDQPVIFSHPVYQYLQAGYGINGRSVHWEPGSMPDEAAKQAFEELLEEFPSSWMIWEAEPDPEIVAWLETHGVSSATFDPCSSQPSDGDFLDIWRKNLTELQRVFETE